MKEIWLPVVEFPHHYEVSNLGRFRRSSSVGSNATHEGRILKSHPTRRGYLGVTFTVGAERFQRRAHRTVAEAFIGAIPDRHVVNHIDGNVENNAASNLEIVSQSENMLHAYNVLGHKAARGEKQHLAKLTDDSVRLILTLSREGASWNELATKFGVTNQAIGGILRGKTWRHVTGLEAAPKKEPNKLSEQTARKILQEYAAGGISQRALAKLYNVSQGTINDLCTGRTWKHLQT